MTEERLLQVAEQSIARNPRVSPTRRKSDVPGWVLDPNAFREPCPRVRVSVPNLVLFPFRFRCPAHETPVVPAYGPTGRPRPWNLVEMHGECWNEGGEGVEVASGQCPDCLTVYWDAYTVGVMPAAPSASAARPAQESPGQPPPGGGP